MTPASVLISGIGIAGPALAYWLLRYGFTPTLVEHAPALRTEGYIVDFWGAGYDITEKMGLLPEILRAGYRVREVRLVDGRGRRVGGFDVDVIRTATNGRYTSLPRGDLSAILYRVVQAEVETLFGNSVVALEEEPDSVLVQFEHGGMRRFDLVIGADGLHSAVRRLAFGPESSFEKFLGYTVAAFEARGYEPRDENAYVAYSAPGRQAARFALRNGRTMVLFVVADDSAPSIHDSGAQESYLRSHFAGLGWECPRLLAALEARQNFYFDRVSQIRMSRWSKKRIALVGDASFAPSLLAGQGSALAIIGAYVLAGELARAARPEDGFANYERILAPFLRRKQDAAERLASSFMPKTHWGIFLRNQVTKAFALPYVAQFAFGSTLCDRIELPSPAPSPTGNSVRPSRSTPN